MMFVVQWAVEVIVIVATEVTDQKVRYWVVAVDLVASLLRTNYCLVIVAIGHCRIGKSIVRAVARIGQKVNHFLTHLTDSAIKAGQTKAKRVVRHYQRCH